MSIFLHSLFHLIRNLFEGGHPSLFIRKSGRQEIQSTPGPSERVRDNFHGQHVREIVGCGPTQLGRRDGRMDVKLTFHDVQIDLIVRIEFYVLMRRESLIEMPHN